MHYHWIINYHWSSIESIPFGCHMEIMEGTFYWSTNSWKKDICGIYGPASASWRAQRSRSTWERQRHRTNPTSRRKRHHLQKDIATALQTAPTTGASQQCGMCFIGQLCILYMYLCSHVYMTYVLVYVGFRFICHNVVVTHFFLTIQMPRRSSSICPGSGSVGSAPTTCEIPWESQKKNGKRLRVEID
jgi:hypothetical protein